MYFKLYFVYYIIYNVNLFLLEKAKTIILYSFKLNNQFY